MEDKEKLRESVRAKVTAVVGGIVVVVGVVGGMFPELQIVEIDPEVTKAVVQGVTALTVAFVLGRSYRNNK